MTGIIYPKRRGESAGYVGIAVDTSGSVSTSELKQMYGEIRTILTEFTPRRVVILWCDADIAAVDDFDGDTPDLSAADLEKRMKKVPGRGGTSFEPPFQWFDKNGAPDQMIYMTDGECPFPKQPRWPVTWLITNNGPAPSWGKVIHVDVPVR